VATVGRWGARIRTWICWLAKCPLKCREDFAQFGNMSRPETFRVCAAQIVRSTYRLHWHPPAATNRSLPKDL
jgi:hypothetical protein